MEVLGAECQENGPRPSRMCHGVGLSNSVVSPEAWVNKQWMDDGWVGRWLGSGWMVGWIMDGWVGDCISG